MALSRLTNRVRANSCQKNLTGNEISIGSRARLRQPNACKRYINLLGRVCEL